MKQRVLIILVGVGIFILMATLLFVTNNRRKTLVNALHESNSDDLVNTIFFKDFLRDTADLSLPMNEPEMKQSFLDQLKNMFFTGKKLKGLTINSCTTVRFNLKTYKDKLIEVEIYDVEELSPQAFVSLSVVAGASVFPAGDYLSDSFLDWIASVKKEPGFGNITEVKRYN